MAYHFSMTNKLLTGFERFRSKYYDKPDSLMEKLVQEGQAPKYFIVSCIDSRSSPATIFDMAPGTFFGHKAMGAIVRPYNQGTALSAALQFTLNYNKVEEIIVLGHTGCGAVQALLENIEDVEIASFLRVAQQAAEKARAQKSDIDLQRRTEEALILQSAANLETYPSVAKALAENRVKIHSWLFDMHNGILQAYHPAKKTFITIAERGSCENKLDFCCHGGL
ncbi:MAG: hypothetical protein GC136_04180 [Alphaproteobacteria bacterium]|nr:hypothetical protein [Alphaproteobacteria bacterium]